ncbi:MAG: hypothetical protein ACK42K_07520, partial [Leptonema sp. (in: bacteria)]
MYSFLKIGIDSDIEITYHNEIFRIKVTDWKHYKICNSAVTRFYHFLLKIGKLKQAFALLKVYNKMP